MHYSNTLLSVYKKSAFDYKLVAIDMYDMSQTLV